LNVPNFSSHGLLIALMMEAATTAEKSVNFCQITRRSNPEDSYLQHKILYTF
jgi:hypothetical protein